MSGDPPLRLRDPAVYRLLAFQGWSPQDAPEESDAALGRLTAVLANLGLCPEGCAPLHRIDMEGLQQVCWDTGWEPGEDGWDRHRFGLSYDEKLAVLEGLVQDGVHDLTAWLTVARERLASRPEVHGDWRGRLRRLELPPRGRAGSAWLGEALVVTGELPEAPAGGWAAFANTRYGSAALVLPWGVLGQVAGERGGPPLLELLTTVTEGALRSRFLYGDLPVVLLEYLKSATYIVGRYRGELSPALLAEERALKSVVAREDPRARQSLDRTAAAVRHLSAALANYAVLLSDLREDLHSVEIARDAVAEVLAGAAERPTVDRRTGFLSGRIDLLARQLAADLHYFELTRERARGALAAHEAFVEIEETRAQRRLGVLGIIVGSSLGLGEILPAGLSFPTKLFWITTPAFLAGLVYWLLAVRNR